MAFLLAPLVIARTVVPHAPCFSSDFASGLDGGWPTLACSLVFALFVFSFTQMLLLAGAAFGVVTAAIGLLVIGTLPVLITFELWSVSRLSLSVLDYLPWMACFCILCFAASVQMLGRPHRPHRPPWQRPAIAAMWMTLGLFVCAASLPTLGTQWLQSSGRYRGLDFVDGIDIRTAQAQGFLALDITDQRRGHCEFLVDVESGDICHLPAGSSAQVIRDNVVVMAHKP
ncbi:MAG: hypothetical protein ACI8W8_004693 [Rhodothermales bacterium]|jgi:hypothetical protein